MIFNMISYDTDNGFVIGSNNTLKGILEDSYDERKNSNHDDRVTFNFP